MKKESQNIVSRTYTAPSKLFNEFAKYCDENSLNRSSVIRVLLTEYLKEQKNK